MILELKIKGKDTIIRCLLVDNSNMYEDTITKYANYNNISTKTIKVTNKCKTGLVLPMQELFMQQDNVGSTFKARIDNTPIPAGQTVDVPVYYNGIYRGASLAPVFNFIINGTPVIYKLNVVNNDILGTIESFLIEKENGEDHVFTMNDFLSHYNDPDITDTIRSVSFTGNVLSLRYQGVAYVVGTEVPVSDIILGQLVNIAPAYAGELEVTFTYKVTDTNDNIIE